MGQRMKHDAARADRTRDAEGDRALVAIVAFPERVERAPDRLVLMESEPEERLATDDDQVFAAPIIGEHLRQQRLVALLDLGRPGLVADRFVRNRVRPEIIKADQARRGEVGKRLAMAMLVQRAAHELAAGADERFLMLDLVAAWIAAEEANGRARIAVRDHDRKSTRLNSSH